MRNYICFDWVESIAQSQVIKKTVYSPSEKHKNSVFWSATATEMEVNIRNTSLFSFLILLQKLHTNNAFVGIYWHSDILQRLNI